MLLTVGLAVLAQTASNSSAQGITEGFTTHEDYETSVASDVDSVPADESFDNGYGWGFNLENTDASASLTGAQISIDTSSTGVDLTNTSFWWAYASSGPTQGPPNPCTASSTTSETCPTTGATIPPSGGTYYGFNGQGPASTWTTGYDSSRTLGPETNGDSPVTVSVTLDDPRYETSPENNILSVATSDDNVDESSTPAVTANGAVVPACSQAGGTPCVQWAFESYKYSVPGGGSTPCNSVAMNVTSAQDTAANGGTPTQYAFKFEENEEGTGGCPTGTPHVRVYAAPARTDMGNTACVDNGTTCASTFSVSGIGNVTASVNSGQGVSDFDYQIGPQYQIDYESSTAPPPPSGSTSSTVGSSASSTGTATATNDDTSVSASGEGAFTLSQFGSDPEHSPPMRTNGEYFDVDIAAGSSFSTLTITDCNLNGGDSLQWWDGSEWANVSPTTYPTTPPDDESGPCLTATLSSTSSPTVSQLFGTSFAVVTRPLLSVLKKTVTVLHGSKLSVRLGCRGVRCHGTISVSAREVTKVKKGGKLVTVARTVVVGRSRYSLVAGKHANEAVALNRSGRLVLGRASKASPLHATLKITVANGKSFSLAVGVV
jgi:hypothetical protein